MENIVYALAFLLKMVPDAPESRILELAPAIAEIASNKQEVAILAATAYYETGPDRYNCKLIGKIGEVSCFQIWTKDLEEKIKLKTTRYAASKALHIIREANKVCRHLHPANRLSYYTAGHCMKEYNARARYVKHLELLQSDINVSEQILALKEKIYPSKAEIVEIKSNDNKPRELSFDFPDYVENTKNNNLDYGKEQNCPICNNLNEVHYCPICRD